MRFEVTIPDNSAEAIILGKLSDPEGYILELVRADVDAQARGHFKEASPDYGAILSQASQSPNCFKTREEVDAISVACAPNGKSFRHRKGLSGRFGADLCHRDAQAFSWPASAAD